ncbi:MAG: trehalose synthase, partial [Microbacteriaceae bacterium]|nr:trehalose synthase [Microbacteriaceae bacterium]
VTDPRMRANIGIRRRLAPLLENDRNQLELFTALLLSLPGSPVLYYGDELGMGDNIWLGDRDAVRTPMQWTPDRNAGFSRADPARLYLPVIMDPTYGYQAVNVESQMNSTNSLLHWTRRMIQVRKQHPAFGKASFTELGSANPAILSYLREMSPGPERNYSDVILCVNNLSRYPQAVVLDLSRFAGWIPVELTGSVPFPTITEEGYMITLPGHGFFWFALQPDPSKEGPGEHPVSSEAEAAVQP